MHKRDAVVSALVGCTRLKVHVRRIAALLEVAEMRYFDLVLPIAQYLADMVAIVLIRVVPYRQVMKLQLLVGVAFLCGC